MNNIFFDPFVIFCTVILLGYAVGQLKIFGFSLDLSAILLVAVFFGMMNPVDIQSIYSTMKTLSSFGTMLFISAIGVNSGNLLRRRFSKIHLYGFFIGSWMVITAIFTMKFFSCSWLEMDDSVLAGILCGALTSTPGLATLSDSSHIDFSTATVGYGSTYLFGVLGTVLFIQILSKIKKVDFKHESTFQKKLHAVPKTKDFIFLQAIIIIGKIIGSISVPILDFSLGSSGGILCCGIIFGLMKKGDADYSLFRNIGLVLFLASSGISAGISFSGALILKNIIIGMLLTIIPILNGYMICLFLKINTVLSLGIVAGGMTSSPAFGVLMKNKTEATIASVYSMSYLGALCTIIIGMRIL